MKLTKKIDTFQIKTILLINILLIKLSKWIITFVEIRIKTLVN